MHWCSVAKLCTSDGRLDTGLTPGQCAKALRFAVNESRVHDAMPLFMQHIQHGTDNTTVNMLLMLLVKKTLFQYARQVLHAMKLNGSQGVTVCLVGWAALILYAVRLTPAEVTLLLLAVPQRSNSREATSFLADLMELSFFRDGPHALVRLLA